MFGDLKSNFKSGFGIYIICVCGGVWGVAVWVWGVWGVCLFCPDIVE